MNRFVVYVAVAVLAAAGSATADPPWPHHDQDHEGGDTSVEVDASSTSAATATAVVESNGSGGNVDFSFTERTEAAASSAATVIAAACSKGGSAQGMGGGASIVSPDEVCQLLALYEVHREREERYLKMAMVFAQLGHTEVAFAFSSRSMDEKVKSDRLLGEATELMRIRTNPLRRFFQGIPFVGNLS